MTDLNEEFNYRLPDGGPFLTFFMNGMRFTFVNDYCIIDDQRYKQVYKLTFDGHPGSVPFMFELIRSY